MPYLRVYSRDLPIEQKRVIAQKLIEITLRTFRLRADERYQTSIQFITLPEMHGFDRFQASKHRDADFTLEVLSHDLTEEKKRAFAEEAPSVIEHSVPAKKSGRIARLLGIKPDTSKQVALQFHELSPAISDPFSIDSDRWVA
jgi:hypothetical protein